MVLGQRWRLAVQCVERAALRAAAQHGFQMLGKVLAGERNHRAALLGVSVNKQVTSDDGVDLVNAHGLQLRRRVDADNFAGHLTAAQAFAGPARRGEVTAVETEGDERGTAAADQLARGGQDVTGQTVERAVALGKHGHVNAGAQTADHGQRGVSRGLALHAGDGSDKENDDLGEETPAENVLAGDERHIFGEREGKQKRIPVGIVVGEDEQGAFGGAGFAGIVKLKLQPGPEHRRERFPYKTVSADMLHIITSTKCV